MISEGPSQPKLFCDFMFLSILLPQIWLAYLEMQSVALWAREVGVKGMVAEELPT